MQYLTNALTYAEPGRLSKALTGLQDGSLHISVTFRTEAEMRAEVTNGDGQPYAVVLTPQRAFCGCKDAQYRQGKVCSEDSPLLLHACKHALALALWALQHPQEAAAEDTSPIHYLRPDGTPWCGRERSQCDWAWGYYPTIKTTWSRPVCATCEAIMHMPKDTLSSAGNTAQSGTRAAA